MAFHDLEGHFLFPRCHFPVAFHGLWGSTPLAWEIQVSIVAWRQM